MKHPALLALKQNGLIVRRIRRKDSDDGSCCGVDYESRHHPTALIAKVEAEKVLALSGETHRGPKGLLAEIGCREGKRPQWGNFLALARPGRRRGRASRQVPCAETEQDMDRIAPP